MSVTTTVPSRYVDIASSSSLYNGGEYSESISSSASESVWAGVYPNDVAGLSSACKITSVSYEFRYYTSTNAFANLRSVIYSSRPIKITGTNIVSNLNGSYTQIATKFCDAEASDTGTKTYSGLSVPVSSSTAVGIRLKCESEQLKSYSRKYYVRYLKIGYTRTRACYISFTGEGVPSTTSDGQSTTNRYYDMGDTVVVPTPSARVGWTFKGWVTSPTSDDYITSIPKAGEKDVTYTAYWEKIPYNINVQTVDQSGQPIDAPTGQTGNTSYEIDGEDIILTAPTTDHIVSDTATYVFAAWSLHNANGDQVAWTSDNTYEGNPLSSAIIQSWFTGGADTIVAKAHYRQVYDIALSIKTDTLSDPAGLGKEGVTSMQIISDGVTHSFTKAQVVAGVTVRVTNKTVEIRTTVTSAQEYSVYSVGCGGTQYDKLISSWEQNTYVTRGDWESSTGYFYLRFNKKYFDITINGDTDQMVKVYRIGSNNTRTLISPTHIARESKIVIEADANAMLQTTSDTAVSTISPDVSGNTSVSGGIGTITSLLQNHTIAVTRTQATCTVTKIINSDGYDPVEEATSVVRSNQYRYIVAAESGWTISSATLTMRGTQIRSWQNVTSIDYTIRSVTGNCVLTVYRAQNPQAYITMKIPTSSYGSVNVIGDTSVLKTDFTGFVVGSITTRPTYDIEYATYEWIEGSETVGTGTINPSVQTTLRYPKSTIPADKDVYVEITVQYRKNALYHSHKQNGETISRQPRSLWYTPIGQAPKQILAVYAQTATHPEPMLLFGPAPEEVEPEPPVERTKYQVLSLESTDCLDGDDVTVRVVWTEDDGTCTPVSFAWNARSSLYSVHLDSITSSFNDGNQLVYTIAVHDENYGQERYSFVCEQDIDGEWVYDNPSYSCDDALLWGTGPASITTVYDDPTT